MEVLVTGGAGYIGSHTCKALKAAGFSPIVFDNFSTGHKDFVKWGPYFDGDLRSDAAIAAVFQSYDIKAVVHFAASALVVESVYNPQKY